jgi:ribosomal protein S18 acetylase RimI-like enzyme
VAAKQLALYQKVGFKKIGVRKSFYVENYPEPIFEKGVQLRDMIVLKKELT